MASPDLPPPPSNHKDDETAKSTPPSSQNDTETTNKRKREPSDSGLDDNEKKISADTTETREMHVEEVEMKDAEAINESAHQGIKEVEMQDAEKSRELEGKERKMHPDINKDDTRLNQKGSKQDKGTKATKLEDKRSDGSGQESLGEVASLLKQVQEESDAKAKVEVEVKVKKLDHGEIEEEQGAAQVSCS